MIPWRLNISGIRDFPPQSIDLSGKNEHIGILGPNGVGKSTLSFCMGAVLYSGKVDLEGLRSANLQNDQVWRASISLLFKNEGEQKVDAPKYVQFELHIEQIPSHTMAREYKITAGDEIDQWDEITTFKSGDKLNNFQAYKRLLQMKYCLDPDYYYLIWYQNEVNQFSEMSPEERFRIFSEMHGIDKIQKNWEESRLLVDEAVSSVEEAKRQQEQHKFNLNIQKQKLDKYLDNQRRLKEGFIQYYQALSLLIILTKEEYERALEEEALLSERINDINEQIVTCDEKQMTNEQQLRGKEQKRERFKNELHDLENKRTRLRSKYGEIKKQYDVLDEELAEIRNEITHIPSEQVVDEMLQRCHESLTILEPNVIRENERMTQFQDEQRAIQAELMKLDFYIREDEQREKKHRQVLSLYESSHVIGQTIQQLDTLITEEKRRLQLENEQLQKYQQEQVELRQNELYSFRQKEAKQYFSREGIEVYALRDLLKIEEHAKLSDEERLNAIKHTMFVNSRDFTPPNDLYYVALPTIIPKEYTTKLLECHLSIRHDLAEELQPLAIKALWWVKSFFDESSAVTIEGNMLRDEKGLRGTQEQFQYILSFQAVQERLKKLEILIAQYEKQIVQLTSSVETNEKEVTKLRNIIGDVKEAEAFMANEKDRLLRQNHLIELQKQNQELLREEATCKTVIDNFQKEISAIQADEKLYTRFKEKWLSFTQEKMKIHELQKLQGQLDILEKEIAKIKNEMDIRLDQYDMCQSDCSNLERKRKEISLEKGDYQNELQTLHRQLVSKTNEKEMQQSAYIQYNEEWNQLKQLKPKHILEEQEDTLDMPSWNMAEAKNFKEVGKTMFSVAVNESDIDIYAPENYEKMKEEFDRSSLEVNASESLLRQNEERMEKLRDDLNSTISGKILIIDKHFVMYMNQFGFEGELDWDMQEDKKGNIRYYLYLKARKYGHKMTMEDVSIKARGGRHGLGLSGGEKSLVSLLYALALLQTIQTNPSFLVLDEFDSALDEGRKVKVFDLYVQELRRKMIVLTPKSHDEQYMSRFSKAYVIYHKPEIPASGIIKLKKKVHEEQY